MKISHARASVGTLCMLFGKTRHAFYDRTWFLEERESQHHLVLEMIAVIRREIPKIGTRKLHHMLKNPFKTHEIKMGRDMLHKFLQENHLIIKPKKRYVKTTDSNHWMKKYPNLIKDSTVTESEQIWVADITYILVADDFNYLNLVSDAYSHRIMGYCLHPTLHAEGTLIALKMALLHREYLNRQLIHHSDRGSQYCCAEYVEILQTSGIKISMTENGDPYENPVAERVNGILKGDFLMYRNYLSRKHALEELDKNIKAYNELRPHMSCNYFTPCEAHKMTGPLEKKWKPKTKKVKIQTL